MTAVMIRKAGRWSIMPEVRIATKDRECDCLRKDEHGDFNPSAKRSIDNIYARSRSRFLTHGGSPKDLKDEVI